MSSTKRKVHNVLQRHRRRTEPWPYATCTKIGKDRACGYGDILADRQTHTQTHTDILITIPSHPSRGWSL